MRGPAETRTIQGMRNTLLLVVVLGCTAEDAAGPSPDADLDAAPPAQDAAPPPADAELEPDAAVLGGFGDPCANNRECRSGYCVEHPEFGNVCTTTCGECPAGFECRAVANAGPDAVFVCLADRPDLCQPCTADRECDDNEDLCLEIGLGRYCGEDCATDGVCPDGYECADARDGARQCVPAGGEGCQPCADADGDGYGDGGDCLGFDCDDADDQVHEGAVERCDGRDQDCDSLVDEGAEPDSECLQLGVCEGSRPVCEGGAWRCTFPATREEGEETRCDGLDNDCDGETDEGLLGTPTHCGACGEACAVANGEAACVEGACVVGACDEGHHDLDGDPRNGCEYGCFPSNDGLEACDGLDNDCDGEADEGLRMEEVCDGLDNDCDGETDEGFDLDADPSHCGACGRACAAANAEVACEGGECRFACAAGFHDANRDPSDGCEYACVPTRGGVEACDAIDNDCDGETDEGVGSPEVCDGADNDCDMVADEDFDLATDPRNCGACGRVCELPNAEARCGGGNCRVGGCADGFWDLDGLAETGCEYPCFQRNGGIEICDGEDDDCDGAVDEDFDLQRDPAHCGACGRDCSLPNAVVTCEAAECRQLGCEAGWHDNDGEPGCEYACEASGDERCDGRDNDCDGETDEGVLNRCGACGPEPEEICNGLDDDCDGSTDEGPLCGQYVQSRCRLFFGWADNRAGPATPTDNWGQCPQVDRFSGNDIRCTGTRRDGRFARLDFAGDVDGNDELALWFQCDDAENPALARYVQTHCAVFLGHADNNAGAAEGSPTWGRCPADIRGDDGQLRCLSSGFDGRWWDHVLVGDVDDNDEFGVAWICRDPVDPARASGLQAAVEVFLGWADVNSGPADGSATWATCPGNSGGIVGRTGCTGTRGDGRFHRQDIFGIGGDVDDNDEVGWALRAR